MPLRVLHLDTGPAWRGGQRQVLLLAEAQRNAGDEPLVMAPPDSPLLERARSLGLATATLRARGDWDLPAAARISRILRAWLPDVVHAHDARAHAIALAALIGHRNLPLVVTRRVALPPRGRLKYGSRVARYIAISGAVRNTLISGGVPRSRIDLVYDGVPTPHVERPRDWRRERGWPPDTVVCGLVGAMTAEKGVGLLDRIAAALPPTDRARARLVLIGGSTVEVGMGMDRFGGVESFRSGFVEDVMPAIAGLDMLWHPAMNEGLGTAVIDAMALGVPPVAFAVGGLPEVIVDGESGTLVTPGDVPAFAAAVGELIDDAERRHRYADCGRLRARDFPVSRMVEGTAQAYQAAIRGARGVAVHRHRP